MDIKICIYDKFLSIFIRIDKYEHSMSLLLRLGEEISWRLMLESVDVWQLIGPPPIFDLLECLGYNSRGYFSDGFIIDFSSNLV